MQKVHCVDYERDIRRILSGCISKILLGSYRMSRQNFGPGLKARTGKVPINTTHACFADFGDFLKQANRNAGGCIIGIDENG